MAFAPYAVSNTSNPATFYLNRAHLVEAEGPGVLGRLDLDVGAILQHDVEERATPQGVGNI